jgi:hypothetical protein
VLTTRAAHHGLGIEQFKRKHLLKTESPAGQGGQTGFSSAHAVLF